MIRFRVLLGSALALSAVVATFVNGQLTGEEKRQRDARIKAREEMRAVASPTPAETPEPAAIESEESGGSPPSGDRHEAERPSYKPPFRDSRGPGDRPPFRGSGDRDSRPPYKRDGDRPPFRGPGGGDSRPPFKRDGDRPPFRGSGGGDSRPPFTRPFGDKGDRPPFKRPPFKGPKR